MTSRRRELAKQLFGLTDGGEAQTKMASRIAEAILSDMVQHCQKAWTEEGPGVLVVRRTVDDARWSPAAMVEENLRTAESCGDTDLADCFRSTLSAISNIDIEQRVPIAIADHLGFRLLIVPANSAAHSIAELLETWNG